MKCSTNETSHGDPALLREIIRGKRVWDIGAGEGKFAQELRNLGADVTCIEIDEVLAFQCREKGIETIARDFEELIPECDVVYAFLSFVGNYKLTRWLRAHEFTGVVVSQYYPLGIDPTNPLKPTKIIHSDLPFLIYDFRNNL